MYSYVGMNKCENLQIYSINQWTIFTEHNNFFGILELLALSIPAKFHDLSVMLTNLKDSHDLTIVF